LDTFCRGVAEALRMHRRMNNPIAIWKDGRAIWRHWDGREVPIRTAKPRRRK
jgi:hypothetical protein